MQIQRRQLVRLGMAAGITAALPWRASDGAEAKRLEVNDPAAISFGYVENVAQVDARKYPEYTKGSSCENCLQLQGSPGSDYRPCGLFPGKLVAVRGWCKAWTPEM